MNQIEIEIKNQSRFPRDLDESNICKKKIFAGRIF
jgi:hypothetical protein